jgi:hypothetical protein
MPMLQVSEPDAADLDLAPEEAEKPRRFERFQRRRLLAKVSTLTRQPVIGNAQAIDEVTVVHVDRAHIEMLVQRNPLLLQEFGRTIEERRTHARKALAAPAD